MCSPVISAEKAFPKRAGTVCRTEGKTGPKPSPVIKMPAAALISHGRMSTAIPTAATESPVNISLLSDIFADRKPDSSLPSMIPPK